MPNPSRAVLQLAEEAEDRFDEACEHARLMPAHASLAIGPSLSVPMAELRPGRLAWSRLVQGGEGQAELFYVLDPTPAAGTTKATELPILGVLPNHVLADYRADGNSPVRLLGIGDPRTAPRTFRSFVRAVRGELASEPD